MEGKRWKKEVIWVMQTNERLVKEVMKRKGCVLIHGVEEENIPLILKREREEINVVKKIKNK